MALIRFYLSHKIAEYGFIKKQSTFVNAQSEILKMMAERIYNISIAGCSKVAHLHAKAIQGISNARIAGVWNRTPSKAHEFASLYKTKF